MDLVPAGSLLTRHAFWKLNKVKQYILHQVLGKRESFYEKKSELHMQYYG